MGREDMFNNYSNYYNNSSSSNYYYSASSSSGAAGGGEAKKMGRRKKKEKVEVPAWLEGLMGATFFGSCGVHEERRKNEKNVFCLICCHSICPHCLPASHHSHPFLQVRRYVYHDVVRLGDLEKLIDCSYIQSYTINSAKVIFVNERPQSRSAGKAATAHNACFACDRILQHPFHFCSLSCKVNHMVEQGEELGSILVMGGGGGTMNQVVVEEEDDEGGSTEDMAFSQFEDLRMDSSEITDDDEGGSGGGGDGAAQLFISSTNSSSSSMAPYLIPDPCGGLHQLGPQRQMLMRNKKKKHGPSGFLQAGITALSFGSRRKGAPHRAPLS